MKASLRVNGSTTSHLVIFAFSALLCAVLVQVKLGSLYGWRYTSDLFTYDQILKETLDGHFGLDYTYGRALGEHAGLLLYLFLPIKLLLGKHAVFFLLLFPTFLHCVAAVLLHAGIRALGHGSIPALLSSLCFLLCFRIAEALYCGFYGVQALDTPAGPLAVLFVLALLLEERGVIRRRWFWVCYLPFLLLREDVALLGAVYFTLLYVLQRRRGHLFIAAISWAATATGWGIVWLSATPFNRGIGAFVTQTLERLLSKGAGEEFLELPPAYVVPLASLIGMMAVATVLGRRVLPHAAALFAIALCKVGMGYVANDTDLTTWHNHPGVVMMTGAIVLQLSVAYDRRTARHTMLSLMLLVSGASFIWSQVPFLTTQMRQNDTSRALVGVYRDDLRAVIAAVPAERVVAIPIWTAIEWTLGGHSRFCFYPRGVGWPPRGIADYIVFESSAVRIRNPFNPFVTRREISDAHPEFEPVTQNRHFLLLRRIAQSDESGVWRREWIRRFGKESLGL